MASPDDFVPLAVTSRSGLDESVHFGAVVALSADGEVAFAAGNPRSIIYPRSATKPMQGLAMVRAGLSLPPELLALVCASHDGSPMHVAGVRRILATAGLGAEALANTAALPVDEEAARDVVCSGGGPAAIYMNCSGKHSGMIATCVHNGWPHDGSYLANAHPLQQAINAVVDEVCGEPHAHLGVDGCGAPTHAMPLVALARAYRAIAGGAAGPAGDEVYAAMTTYPEMVSGPRRDVARLMRGIPGLLAKDGAEGVYALALPDGRAVALKIADGADRARPAVLLAVLEMLGVNVAELQQTLQVAIMGHGRQVGTVRAILP